jgi:hypothetical protein
MVHFPLRMLDETQPIELMQGAHEPSMKLRVPHFVVLYMVRS